MFFLFSSLVPPFVIVHLALPLMSSTMKMIIYFILLDERAQQKKASSDLYSIKVAVAAAVIVKIDKTIWPKIEDWMCVCARVSLCESIFGSRSTFLLRSKEKHEHGFHETGTNRYYIISIH